MNKLISVLFNIIIFGVIFMVGTWAGGRNAVNNINQSKVAEPAPIITPAPIINNIISVYKKVYYNDVKEFLVTDKTDTLKYTSNKFDCKNFSSTLKEKANSQGMLCAVVILDYNTSASSHAINAFDTIDYGVIFVEPQSDVMIEDIHIGENYDELVGKFTGKPVAINIGNKITNMVYIW